jgi:hypothetical protein
MNIVVLLQLEYDTERAGTFEPLKFLPRVGGNPYSRGVAERLATEQECRPRIDYLEIPKGPCPHLVAPLPQSPISFDSSRTRKR